MAAAKFIQCAIGLSAEVDSLALDKLYRNHGIGSMLVREVVKEMCPRDFRLVFALNTAV